MQASGETLEHINQAVFLNADERGHPILGGMDYLLRVAQGHADDTLYGDEMIGGAKELATYLIKHRPRLGLVIGAAPAKPPARPAPAPIIKRNRKPRAPKPKNE
jgi:hypothetical protein